METDDAPTVEQIHRLVEVDRLMDEIDRLYGQEGVDFVFGGRDDSR